jgi:hypothetical protein
VQRTRLTYICHDVVLCVEAITGQLSVYRESHALPTWKWQQGRLANAGSGSHMTGRGLAVHIVQRLWDKSQSNMSTLPIVGSHGCENTLLR